jgi:cell division protein FtsZ
MEKIPVQGNDYIMLFNKTGAAQQNPEQTNISKEDAELLKFLVHAKPSIAVIGTGGSGCNTLNRLFELGIEGASLIAVNTDVQHLLRTKAGRKLLIGKKLTHGMGAGSNPLIGENAAKESVDEISELLKGFQMVFVTCGLGGGTGTGSAPVIADIAKKKGNALTIAIVTLPFVSEGRTRMKNAIEGLDKLRKQVDTVIVIQNDKLLSIAPDLPLNTAFKVCDEVLAGSVKGITELITKVGMVNLDFADLTTILTDAGCAVIGVGESSVDVKPDNRALVAMETALSSPLLDVDISSADRALVNITGGEDMTLHEAELVVSEVSKRISPSSHIIWGSRIEKNLGKNALRVLIVIAGTKSPKYDLEEIMGAHESEIDLDLVG